MPPGLKFTEIGAGTTGAPNAQVWDSDTVGAQFEPGNIASWVPPAVAKARLTVSAPQVTLTW